MTRPTLWTQEQLAQHWLLSEGTLERWRCEGIGPVYLKIRGQVSIRCEWSGPSKMQASVLRISRHRDR